MLFHIEYRCQGRWEAFGSGEGEGSDAGVAALGDLKELAGGNLPVGTYRCIPANTGATRWESLALGADGRIVFADDDADLAANR